MNENIFAQVTEQWVARYDGKGKEFNDTHAITISDSGYVYVTGSRRSLSTLKNYCTIKYNQTGKIEWEAFYGTENEYSVPYAIIVDTVGNVFVTGESNKVNFESQYSFCTVKYNAGGEEEWVTRTVLPDADGAPFPPMAIDLDINGNVFIMGNLRGVDTEHWYANDNFITIKYSSAGTELWSQSYDGAYSYLDEAFDMEVGKFGNVYVTGYVSQLIGTPQNEYLYSFQKDYITIKYSANGAEQWVATYNSDLTQKNRAYALVLDDVENVYITGETENMRCTTIKYSSLGQELWVTESYNLTRGRAIALDGNRNVYVAGDANDGGRYRMFGTTKLSNSGQNEWERFYKGPGDDNRANAITIDDSSNVYVTGFSLGDSTNYDYATLKYNTLGEEQWSFRYNGTGNDIDKPVGIVVDSFQNVYVTGTSQSDTSYNDFVTIKYGYADSLFPRIEASVNSVNFDSVAVGTEESLSFTIYSKGSLSLTISNILINNSAFSTDYTSSVSTIIPGDSLVIKVFFTPGNNMDYNGVLTIECNDHPVEVQLFGIGMNVTGIGEKPFSDISETFSLGSAYPNPFFLSTKIEYSIGKSSPPGSDENGGLVILKVYDILGQEVATLVNKQQPPGKYEVRFIAGDLPSGIYYYNLTIGKYVKTKKMIIQK
jgi:hypothetical protein